MMCHSRLVIFTTRKSSVFRTRQQVACEMFICRKRSEHLVEKKLSLVVFDSNCSSKTVKCSFFNQIIVYQSFYCAPLTFNYVLLQGKVVCFGMRFQVACLDRVEKMLSFGCVCCMKMGLKRVSPVPFDKKTVNF